MFDNLKSVSILVISCWMSVIVSVSYAQEPSLFSDSASKAFVGESGPVSFPIQWDFVGQYDFIVVADNSRWMRSLYDTYRNFGEIRFSQSVVEIIRTTIPEDYRDQIPSVFTWRPTMVSGEAENKAWAQSEYGVWYDLGISVLSGLTTRQLREQSKTQKSLFRELSDQELEVNRNWRNARTQRTALYQVQFFDGEEWRYISDFGKQSRRFQAYDIKTVAIMGNQVAMKYWDGIPNSDVQCMAEITLKQVEHSFAVSEVASQGKYFNAYGLIDYVSGVFGDYSGTYSMMIGTFDAVTLPSCGEYHPSVFFTGHIDFGDGPFFGQIERSSLMSFDGDIIPVRPPKLPQESGWELACASSILPDRHTSFNTIVIDCNDRNNFSSQLKTIWRTLVARGAGGQEACYDRFLELLRYSDESWPIDYPEQFFNSCNSALHNERIGNSYPAVGELNFSDAQQIND